MSFPLTPAEAFKRRRRALHDKLKTPAVILAGSPVPRNFRDNLFPFRATSHFLYFVGRSMAGAALVFEGGKTTLFAEPPDDDDALWHGPRPSLASLREELALDEVKPLDTLDETLARIGSHAAALPTNDAASTERLAKGLGRSLRHASAQALAEGSPDAALADALIAIRLCHDDAAIEQLRSAAEASGVAHAAGMMATRRAASEREIAAAMTASLRANGLEDAYSPIVTVHGEVLHAQGHENAVKRGDLLLADVGGESPEGWAADITRTWPISGTFSPTQRAIYEVVLAAQKAAIAAVKPGASYRAIHHAAAREIVSGLAGVGIFKGAIDGLLERNAQAVFFPHGVGHLLGLDVHDMEDLGDRAGYAPGRSRSTLFGERFLRLDRDLEAGMAVTIEPGFYQVRGILESEQYTKALGSDLDRNVLARFSDVRGIRIEDDVLVTEDGSEVLSRAAPKAPDVIEAIVSGA